jgi:hypothetical protein
VRLEISGTQFLLWLDVRMGGVALSFKCASPLFIPHVTTWLEIYDADEEWQGSIHVPNMFLDLVRPQITNVAEWIGQLRHDFVYCKSIIAHFQTR